MTRIETLYPAAPSGPSVDARQAVGPRRVGEWWTGYLGRLSNLSDAAKRALHEDSLRIADAVAPMDAVGQVNVSKWPSGRVRTGVVVGSVQSGKTASMLAVSAHLLDLGVNVLVVLAGTRVALWMQTLERLLERLDGSTPATAWLRDDQRIMVPAPEDILNNLSRLPAKQYLAGKRYAANKAVKTGLPVVLVVPKEDDHLIELGKFLEAICPNSLLTSLARPISMVVLDDEADDGSILDAADLARVTPQYIQRLWADRHSGDATRHVGLFASYVAYTATPQANFLQRSHNPLWPRHFQIALRVPLDHGTVGMTTFAEPAGVKSFYCGGELFYERYRRIPGDFCVAAACPDRRPNESDHAFKARFDASRSAILSDALRAYFVAGALRLQTSGKALTSLRGLPSMPFAQLTSLLPPTHSMLFHPSALREEHFAGAREIANWSRGLPPNHTDEYTDLSVEGLSQRLLSEEAEWKRWVSEYRTAASVQNLLPGAKFRLPDPDQWTETKRVLLQEVFPNVKLRVLNSDPRADDRPQFEPIPSGGPGLFVAPPDVFTIFVAGNVLSRGLTVNGLCTSVFLRASDEPAADTQMQMQRWFGYRGSHLPYCKLFLQEDQLELFRRYHSNDEALKTEIIRRCEPHEGTSEALVLQGATFRATSKVDSRKVPLHPGPTPAIRLIETDDQQKAKDNLAVVRDLVGSGTWVDLEEPAGTVRGLIRHETLTLVEVAETLGRLRYTKHRPRADEAIHFRWGQLATLLGLREQPFRAPTGGSGSVVEPAGCPYSIAAYLRLWSEMLSIRIAPGLYPTDSPRLPWSMIDLQAYSRSAPRFYVGVRFGEEALCDEPVLRSRMVKTVRRAIGGQGITVKALWGTRGTGGSYFGDQMFDYHLHRTSPIPKLHEDVLWRPRGHPGLLLFYVTQTAIGDQPLVGLAIPHGGPDHIAALRVTAEP